MVSLKNLRMCVYMCFKDEFKVIFISSQFKIKHEIGHFLSHLFKAVSTPYPYHHTFLSFKM